MKYVIMNKHGAYLLVDDGTATWQQNAGVADSFDRPADARAFAMKALGKSSMYGLQVVAL